MLLTRFWNVLIALVLGATVFVLYLAFAMYNRAGARAMAEALSADSQVVSWYLKDDSRQRAAQLISFAVDPELAKALAKSSESDAKVPDASRETITKELRQINEKIPREQGFDAVFAVDQHGRVVGRLGYDQATGLEDFELGGYPVVADALHGYIRDDTLILDRMYRVVARPVELEVGQPPAGAIIGARIIDDRFARELSQRTGAAIGFFARGQRESSGAPEEFDKSQLDQIMGDLEGLAGDKDFQEKGRSKVRVIGDTFGVQYSRLQGEAWALGAGFAVARVPSHVANPLSFLKADDVDKSQASIALPIAIALGAAILGLLFSILEHSRPLSVFRKEALRMAKGEVDQLQPSKFRGVFRRIATDLNDGIDHVAAKGGVPRKAADLSQVLGDLPDQPTMSAFSFPGDASNPAQSAPLRSAPNAAPARTVPQPAGGAPPPPRRALPKLPGAAAEPAPEADLDPAAIKLAEWRKVHEDFVALKRECGEDVEGFTYEKFETTLRKNEEALVKRHGASRVKFSVYVKEGKAALKASPIRD